MPGRCLPGHAVDVSADGLAEPARIRNDIRCIVAGRGKVCSTLARDPMTLPERAIADGPTLIGSAEGQVLTRDCRTRHWIKVGQEVDSMPILMTKLPDWSFDVGQAVRVASKARGISAARLTLEMAKLRFGRQKLGWQDYFLAGAHRPWHTDVARAEFIGQESQLAINGVFARKEQSLRGLVTDKLLVDLILTRVGLPVAPIRAIATVIGSALPYQILPDASAVDRFMAEVELPLFGKPVHGSRSLAAVSIVGRNGNQLELGDGRLVGRANLAAEVLQRFPAGYLFQQLIEPHPDLAELIGPVLGTVRVVTLRIGKEVVPLYGALKMPGAGAMVDDVASTSSMLCAVDISTGRIIRAQERRRLGGMDLVTHPVTGAILPGAQVPLWNEVMTLAGDCHRLLHRQGIVGGDFAITPAGPLVIELNANPLHGMYQKSQTRGLWNPDLAPLLTEAMAGFGHKARTKEVPYP